MEGVVLLIVAAYAAKIMIEDLSFAVRGRPSPRQAIRMARANGQSDRSGGAARRYLGDVWADAWTGATRRHRQRRERRQSRPAEQKRSAGPARTYLRNRVGDAHAGVSRRWATGWERAESRHQRRQQRRRQQRAATATHPSAVAQKRSSAVMAVPVASSDASEPIRQSASASATEETEVGSATQTPEAEPSGTTTTPTTEGEDDMSMPNGEVTGLRSAIGYAEELASEADQAVTALETLSAGLRSGGTGENTIGKFDAAGEHFGAAAAQLREAARELSQQLSVTEAYEANPDAGEKDFVTAD